MVVGVHELMAEGTAFLEIQHGLIDNDEVLGFIVEAAQALLESTFLHLYPVTGGLLQEAVVGDVYRPSPPSLSSSLFRSWLAAIAYCPGSAAIRSASSLAVWLDSRRLASAERALSSFLIDLVTASA